MTNDNDVFVPTRVQIIRELDALAKLASDAPTIHAVRAELRARLSQVACDINNRAGIETGRIRETQRRSHAETDHRVDSTVVVNGSR